MLPSSLILINDLCERTIRDRMAQEFGTVNNASAKSREERETTLRKQYEAVFYDPGRYCEKSEARQGAYRELPRRNRRYLG